MSDGLGMVVALIGIVFNLLGCIGLIRLPDVYNRLQAATKCVTLGTCLLLTGVVIMTESVPCGLKAWSVWPSSWSPPPPPRTPWRAARTCTASSSGRRASSMPYAEDGQPDAAREDAS